MGISTNTGKYFDDEVEFVFQSLTAEPPSGVPQGEFPGMLEPGNIDLDNRPIVMRGGRLSTVRSISVNFDDKEVVIPTISDDAKELDEMQAIELYERTGKHLGKFDTPENAITYAQALHAQQEKRYKPLYFQYLMGKENQMFSLDPNAQSKDPRARSPRSDVSDQQYVMMDDELINAGGKVIRPNFGSPGPRIQASPPGEIVNFPGKNKLHEGRGQKEKEYLNDPYQDAVIDQQWNRMVRESQRESNKQKVIEIYPGRKDNPSSQNRLLRDEPAEIKQFPGNPKDPVTGRELDPRSPIDRWYMDTIKKSPKDQLKSIEDRIKEIRGTPEYKNLIKERGYDPFDGPPPKPRSSLKDTEFSSMERRRDLTEGRLPRGESSGGGGNETAIYLEGILTQYARGQLNSKQVQKAFKDKGWTVDLRRGRYDYEAFDPSGKAHYLQP